MASNPLPGYDAWKLAEPPEWHKGHSAACRRHNHRVEDPDCICGFEKQQEAERDEAEKIRKRGNS